MWAVAGVLLGVFLLTSLLGFHLGPHGHGAATIFGLLGAIWLAIIALTREPGALVWTLFGGDLCLTAGVGILAWNGLHQRSHHEPSRYPRLLGRQGVATSSLTPRGTVKVKGEEWSAVSLNGQIESGSRVQVIGLDGIRLEVWGESPDGVVESGAMEDGHDEGATS